MTARLAAVPAPRPAPATYTDAKRELLLLALEDAATYRQLRAGNGCDDCDRAPDHVCSEHAADLDRADGYADLASELEGSP